MWIRRAARRDRVDYLPIAVNEILECLAGGMSEDEILHDFPDLERDDIRAAIAFAAETTKSVRRPLVE